MGFYREGNKFTVGEKKEINETISMGPNSCKCSEGRRAAAELDRIPSVRASVVCN